MDCPKCGAALSASGYTEEDLGNDITVVCQVFACSNSDCDFWTEDNCIEEPTPNRDADETEDVELPPELQQRGYYIQSEQGHVGHVWGSPDMSEETKNALRQLIDLAHKALDRGAIEPESDDE